MNSYLYLAILTVHLAALALFGGMVLITDLARLGVRTGGYSVDEIAAGLRAPKRAGFALAAGSGAILFAAEPAHYVHDIWFWSKMILLLLAILSTRVIKPVKLAGALSLALWTAVVCTGRGPATVKDVMHSMVDPSGDYVFESVKQVADANGSHLEAPQTNADWDDLRQRLEILQGVPALLAGRRAARIRDRSKNPEVESEPEQIESALNADPPALMRRARKLQNAATLALQAVDARDTQALLKDIDSIDKACENCHLHYWYPNDKRARQAAKDDGVTDY